MTPVLDTDILFQFPGKETYLDFLLKKTGEHKIIDAKYKPNYKNNYSIEDIRQLSGYGRDKKVLKQLGYDDSKQETTVVPCLIIYPDQYANENLWLNPEEIINGFVKFYKRAVKLPEIEDI